MSDDPRTDRHTARMNADHWIDKAQSNVDEWGEQSVATLLLAMQEELGELSQAHLEAENEDGDVRRLDGELDDLAALCVQLRWRLESL